ncbi:hypothetical protein EDD70_2764 [Hydrogenoanaerobacterium saccharovorans]|uniref:Uncharacterized protein n=1 Tax=Hydrogenoanaerobacterium saccharovorans TaxID=474960 RepID=A0A1H8DWW5_9FIRM|nr:hypothetical protein [Hydrogenoanaerobacterium saccharovorans]RPF42420.1 hypothetical protein EDD70_2764 [Hydrogenoanaerobacterium saccharovorans]SEN11344.1 hypothetical protein SAMN05216180_2825 [Hydrogenoanaerobacterium saccharovorans]
MKIETIKQNTIDSSKSLVCIHTNENGEPRGEIYNRYLVEPIAFTDMFTLINEMDAFFDQTGYPQAYNEYRTFVDKKKEKKFRLREAESDLDDMFLENTTGDKATFVIQVQFRQNSSWQGTITWAEGKKTQRYRSTLEMIKLMDSVLTAEDEKKTQTDPTESD